MTQTSRLVLEIDSRDAEQKAADVRKALDALESAGLSIKPAMDTAGKGLDGLNESGKRAESTAARVGRAWAEATSGIQSNTQQIVKELQALNAKQEASSRAFDSVVVSLSKVSSSLLPLQHRWALCRRLTRRPRHRAKELQQPLMTSKKRYRTCSAASIRSLAS